MPYYALDPLRHGAKILLPFRPNLLVRLTEECPPQPIQHPNGKSQPPAARRKEENHNGNSMSITSQSLPDPELAPKRAAMFSRAREYQYRQCFPCSPPPSSVPVNFPYSPKRERESRGRTCRRACLPISSHAGAPNRPQSPCGATFSVVFYYLESSILHRPSPARLLPGYPAPAPRPVASSRAGQQPILSFFFFSSLLSAVLLGTLTLTRACTSRTYVDGKGGEKG